MSDLDAWLREVAPLQTPTLTPAPTPTQTQTQTPNPNPNPSPNPNPNPRPHQVAALQKLQHPNVVKYLGAVIEPPTHALVLEYLEP